MLWVQGLVLWVHGLDPLEIEFVLIWGEGRGGWEQSVHYEVNS